jgi:hypothetical protein
VHTEDGRRHTAIESKEAEAENEKKIELEDDEARIEHEGALSIEAGSAPEEALDKELIGAVGGHREKCSTEDAAEKSVGGGEKIHEASSPVGIENLEFVGAVDVRESDDVAPAVREGFENEDNRNDGSEEINCELDDIHGDNGFEPAHIGVEKRAAADDEDAEGIAEAGDNVDGNGGGEEAHTGCEDARDDENGGSEFSERGAESLSEKIVRGFEIAFVICGDEDDADEEAANEVSEGELEEVKVAAVGETRNADEGESAGFAGDDGETDRPPSHGFTTEEVIASGALLAGEERTGDCYAGEVGEDDYVIKG